MKFEFSAGFAKHVRDSIERLLRFAEARVSFRGLFAEGTHDEYSDVDLLAEVHCELDRAFFSNLESVLTSSYGPALVRYDPDSISAADFQHVRFSFYNVPIFWRVDLDTSSSKPTCTKHPTPLLEWQIGTSALMNVVFAVKYHNRRNDESADHYLHSACEKLDCEDLEYSAQNVQKILAILGNQGEADAILLAKTRGELVGD